MFGPSARVSEDVDIREDGPPELSERLICYLLAPPTVTEILANHITFETNVTDEDKKEKEKEKKEKREKKGKKKGSNKGELDE